MQHQHSTTPMQTHSKCQRQIDTNAITIAKMTTRWILHRQYISQYINPHVSLPIDSRNPKWLNPLIGLAPTTIFQKMQWGWWWCWKCPQIGLAPKRSLKMILGVGGGSKGEWARRQGYSRGGMLFDTIQMYIYINIYRYVYIYIYICIYQRLTRSWKGKLWGVSFIIWDSYEHMSFHSHRGRSAEGLWTILGRHPWKSWVEKLMLRNITNLAYQLTRKVESLLLPARGKPAEDMRKTSSKDINRGTHGMENHLFSFGIYVALCQINMELYWFCIALSLTEAILMQPCRSRFGTWCGGTSNQKFTHLWDGCGGDTHT